MSGRAVLVCVGDELLSGRVIDTNSSFLRERLAAAGYALAAVLTVGDRLEDISATLRAAMGLGRLVFVTGGLGPTSDDITREGLADALGRRLVTDESIVKRLKQRFADMGFDMPETNLRQAQVLEGITAVIPGKGTAPGLEVEAGGTRVFLLPGVPSEMRDMMDQSILPALRSEGGEIKTAGRLVKLFARAEALVGEEVDALLPPDGSVKAAYLAGAGMIEVHLKAEGAGGEALEAALDGVVAGIRDKFGASVVATEDRGLAEVAGDLLREKGLTLAVAESCTGGMLGELVTQVPGSSAWFLGGVISYAAGVKVSLLGVEESLIRKEGVVSEAVARAMARGARQTFSSDLALGITGVAGPDGGTPETPVGTVCLALAAPDGEYSFRRRLPGDRELVRRIAANTGLFVLKAYLSGEPVG